MKASDLNERLAYDPESGVLTWKERPLGHFKQRQYWLRWNKLFAGSVAGTISSNGYVVIEMDGVAHKAHRLAWQMTHGDLPKFIDHINGDRGDNRIENLRPASGSGNARNRKTQGNNTSGIKGVVSERGKWKAQLSINRKHLSLGYFSTKEEAGRAVRSAREKLHGKFCNHG
jgi:hypothetical protein